MGMNLKKLSEAKRTELRDGVRKEIVEKNDIIEKMMLEPQAKDNVISEGKMLMAVSGEIRPEVRRWLDAVFPACVRGLGLQDAEMLVVFNFEKGKMRRQEGDAATNSVTYRWQGRKVILMTMQALTFVEDDQRVEAFAHEMVHVEQHARGRLRFDLDALEMSWDGKLYDVDRMHQAEGAGLLAAALGFKDVSERLMPPWERDAYPRGKELAAKVVAEYPWTK